VKGKETNGFELIRFLVLFPGSSLIILIVFIFALVYYRRDKKRVEEMMRRKGRRGSGDEEADHRPALTNEEDELRNYGPPELLKSNSTTATSFHQSHSQSSESGGGGGGMMEEEGVELNYGLGPHRGGFGHQPPPCFYNDINDMIPSHQPRGTTTYPGRPHKEVHFSPRPSSTSQQAGNYHQSNPLPPNHHPQVGNRNQSGEAQEAFPTLPRIHPHQNQVATATVGEGQEFQVTVVGIGNHVGQGGAAVAAAATLPKKPAPPTRNFMNYNISQRQIFSLIMSLMTLGIL